MLWQKVNIQIDYEARHSQFNNKKRKEFLLKGGEVL